METLPGWFWIIYYLFFLVTLGTAIFSVIKKQMNGLPLLAIVLTLAIPIVSLINCIGRFEDMNEFEYLVSELLHGAIWSIFVVVGYFCLLIWWGLFFRENKVNS